MYAVKAILNTLSKTLTLLKVIDAESE